MIPYSYCFEEVSAEEVADSSDHQVGQAAVEVAAVLEAQYLSSGTDIQNHL